MNSICDLPRVRAEVAAAIAADGFQPVATAFVLEDAAESERKASAELAALQQQVVKAECVGDGVKLAKLAKDIIAAKKAIVDAKELSLELGKSHQRLAASHAAAAQESKTERCLAAQRILKRETDAAADRFQKISADGQAILAELLNAQRDAIGGAIHALAVFAAKGDKGVVSE